MPYEWTAPPIRNQPKLAVKLWPYQSLKPRGFVVFIGLTAAMSAFPLLAVIGSAIMWVLLVFAIVALGAIWLALFVSNRRGTIVEEFVLTPETASLTRTDADGQRQTWQANRHWVKAELHQEGGPVKNYVTLRGGDREVEIGRFLDEKERLAFYSELRTAIPYVPPSDL